MDISDMLSEWNAERARLKTLVAGWKQWHDELANLLPTKYLERTITLDAVRELIEAARAMVEPLEVAGYRALAGDGPVPDDLILMAKDKDLRRGFDAGFRRLREALGEE